MDGRVVATAAARSYGSLFDLPDFDTRTLASLQTVTLYLDGGLEATYSICGAKAVRVASTIPIPSGSNPHPSPAQDLRPSRAQPPPSPYPPSRLRCRPPVEWSRRRRGVR